MKKISIIAAGLLLATGAMAQQMPQGKYLIGKPMSKHEKSRMQTLRLTAKPTPANKSTASYERMRAMSEYGQDQGGQIIFYDSLQFNYSGMRGSEFDFNSMSIGNYDPMYGPITPQNQLIFHPDDLQVYAPGLVANITLTYDADENVTEFYMVNNGSDDERYLFTYNNSKIVYAENLVANGPDWDTTYRRYFNYDMNDMLVEDSIMENQGGGVWSIYQKYEYTYDVDGNIISLKTSNTGNMNNVFQPYEEDQYTYNSNGQLETATYAFYNELTTTMDLEYKDSFEYTTGFDFFTKDNYYLWDDVNTVWENDGYMERTLNAQMLPEVAKGYEWDGTSNVQAMEEYYSYNTNGNPIHDSIFVFTNGTIDEDPIYLIHYYYEEYYDLGVDGKTAQAQISVYPNPASDVLNINSSSNEAMHIQLVNALGQTVKKARTTSAQAKLSIGDLTAGMYWLTVTDKAGNKLHQQAVVKQ